MLFLNGKYELVPGAVSLLDNKFVKWECKFLIAKILDHFDFFFFFYEDRKITRTSIKLLIFTSLLKQATKVRFFPAQYGGLK